VISRAHGASQFHISAFAAAAPSLSVAPIAVTVAEPAEITENIEACAREPNGALFFPRDNFIYTNRSLVIELARRHRLPAVYAQRQFVAEGGLMSYGIDVVEPYRGAASYVDRILRGERIQDLPVQQPTKFEFALNMRAAKALGLNVPLAMQVSADEVIE
jgi:putative ABC transport system substrate-binding protein